MSLSAREWMLQKNNIKNICKNEKGFAYIVSAVWLQLRQNTMHDQSYTAVQV